MGLELVRRFHLPSFTTGAGELTVIEALPFEIQRVFFIHHLPDGASRGSHANRDEHVFVAVSGSLELFLDDGADSANWKLTRPDEGIYVPPLVWRELRSFTSETICLVFSSRRYNADDYIRDYAQFVTESSESIVLGVPDLGSHQEADPLPAGRHGSR